MPAMPRKPSLPSDRRSRAAAQPKPSDTEVEAYKFILDQLSTHGWNMKNPSRHADGQVWTQNQCLAHPEIKRALGATRPENIVKLSESRLWVIEAKRDRKELEKAVREAAEYTDAILAGGVLDVLFITGVAGNDTANYLLHLAGTGDSVQARRTESHLPQSPRI